MKVHIVQVMLGEKLEIAGVFSVMEDAYSYLRNSNLVGVVTSTEVIN
jgi:hypothetical protein